MEDNKKKDPLADAGKGSDPTARDFQRTEPETDEISQSEKDEMNRRTEEANTKPDKDRLNN